MAIKVADTERIEVESAVRNAIRKGEFLCPECNERSDDFVSNSKYGFVCLGCDWAIKFVE